jgi:hypothetical protein
MITIAHEDEVYDASLRWWVIAMTREEYMIPFLRHTVSSFPLNSFIPSFLKNNLAMTFQNNYDTNTALRPRFANAILRLVAARGVMNHTHGRG